MPHLIIGPLAINLTMETPATPVRIEASIDDVTYDLNTLTLAEEDISEEIVKAAAETAAAHNETTEEFELRRLTFRACQAVNAFNEAKFRSILSIQSSLATSRATNLENIASDGQVEQSNMSRNNFDCFHVD